MIQQQFGRPRVALLRSCMQRRVSLLIDLIDSGILPQQQLGRPRVAVFRCCV